MFRKEIMFKKYSIKTVTNYDISRIVRIYNSNKMFLENHLAVSEISNDFIHNEIEEMKKIGFRSILIIDNEIHKAVGLCDYKIGECTYLSLLMVDGKMKRKGLGTQIYTYLEREFINQKAHSVRIDVVDDYEGNAAGFWIKQGFR